METLECRNLAFTYKQNAQKTLQNISFSLQDGDFALLCGDSGCGKTTLLRLIKREIAPFGIKSGALFFKGKNTEDLTEKESVASIGYVGKDCPLTSEFVYTQLAFILESLSLAPEEIKLRLAEICAEFSLEKLFDKKTALLSAGEKQKVALASVLAARPRLLLLDEPLSNLDPVAAVDFLLLLQKYGQNHNMTVLMAEQNLKTALPFCNKLLFLQEGKIAVFDETAKAIQTLFRLSSPYFQALPDGIQIFYNLKQEGKYPLTLPQYKAFLEKRFHTQIEQTKQATPAKNLQIRTEPKDCLLQIRDLYFRYSAREEFALQNLSLKLNRGSCTALLGANGSGKSTLLKLIAGIYRPTDGKIKLSDKAYLLPQQAGDIFTQNSIRAEFDKIFPQENWQRKAEKLGLGKILDKHYLDLSSGELQKCALLKILLKKPALLLLDEPTCGLDFQGKKELSKLLRALCAEGITVLFSSHDMDFCADTAQDIILLFNKNICCRMKKRDFLLQSDYYTTQTAAACKNLLPFISVQELLAFAQSGA